MGTRIKKIAYILPSNILTNEMLSAEFPNWTPEKIEEKIGVRQRHVVAENETAADLAFQAAEKVLLATDKNEIDFLLLCTQSPDYFLPTTACMLQDKLGLRKNIGALDYNLGCSGFVYGLALAKGLISGGLASKILLITAETYSKHLHHKDKGNRTIFGDAAAATIIEKSEDEAILNFELGTDGSGYANLIVTNGGLRNRKIGTNEIRKDESGEPIYLDNLYMNGPEIFNFTISNVPKMLKVVLAKNELQPEDIDFYIFHQANKYMLDYLRKKAKIEESKFYSNMLETGNTVSSTIPIALANSIEQGLVKKGDKIMLAGFGVGYSWGACIIKL